PGNSNNVNVIISCKSHVSSNAGKTATSIKDTSRSPVAAAAKNSSRKPKRVVEFNDIDSEIIRTPGTGNKERVHISADGSQDLTEGRKNRSVKFQLLDRNEEWHSKERSEIFNEKVHEERRKLKMKLQQLMVETDTGGLTVFTKGTADAAQGSTFQWKGSLCKADPIQNIATVNIKPFPGRREVMSNDRVWMKSYITLSYAWEIIDPDLKVNLYVVEPIKKATSVRNISEEYVFMKDNEIVGVIWLNAEKTSCWFVFPTTNKLAERLKLVERPNVPYVIYEKILPDNAIVAREHEGIFNDEIIQNNPSLLNIEASIYINNYHKIMEICKSPGVRYMNFAPDPDECSEVKDMINIMDYLGAVHNKDYNDDIELVLASVHCLYEKQLLFMENLSNLKRLPNCKFREYGVNPKSRESHNFEEFFPQGGILTVTTAVFIKEQEVISRILAVMKHQNKVHDGSRWELVLNENILEYLTYVVNSMETR
ncbi:7371_t:CDS:10, partial [Acaulospora colombiana]